MTFVGFSGYNQVVMPIHYRTKYDSRRTHLLLKILPLASYDWLEMKTSIVIAYSYFKFNP